MSSVNQEVIKEITKKLTFNAEKTLNGMLKINAKSIEESIEHAYLKTNKTVFVSVFFTGVVYGEFILSMSDDTARKISHLAEGEQGQLDDGSVIKVEALTPLTEILNIISGQTITELGRYYDKLTLTAPRVYLGSILYPDYPTGKMTIQSQVGDIECYFYLDQMQLDLAVSYQEAMQSLIGTNHALSQANEALKKQQAQLVHSEKMASLGMMAAGVAHEINNPLAYVDSNISTLEDYSLAIQELLRTHEILLESLIKKNKQNVRSSLGEIRKIKEKENFDRVLKDTKEIFDETRYGVKRIKEIITGLKKFSHIDQSELKEVDLNEEIDNMLRLVSNQLKYKCEVTRNFENIPKISCYPGQLNQVFVNMLVNAAQAMPDKGGEIKISTRVKAESQEEFIEITFQDTGSGIAPENLNKIFDPFFSTKPVGEGTGLGLSISYGIVEKHGGRIDVESQMGQGTTFHIQLPTNRKPLPKTRQE